MFKFMDYRDIIAAVLRLSAMDRTNLLAELRGVAIDDTMQSGAAGIQTDEKSMDSALSVRGEQLKNRQMGCPLCGGRSYLRYGKAGISQRFKCKDCGRTFSEFTGTWLDGIQKKSKAPDYIRLMLEGKSLDRIVKELHINKKTVFDWRHKILSSLEQDSGYDMTGIVESDETFFEKSSKGSRDMERPARKRGGDASGGKKKRGVSTDKLAVIVTADRKGKLNICASAIGGVGKEDITRSLDKPLPEGAILCTDGHVAYKGFAIDNNLKHIAIRTNLREHVRQRIYHIQNINSIHNRLKKWINNNFWGVSTKYMQNYLNWSRINQTLKSSADRLHEFIYISLQNPNTIKRFNLISFSYQCLLTT